MKGRHLFILASIAVLMTGIFSYKHFDQSKLYRFLLSSENNLQMEVTPLVLREPEIPLVKRSLFANLSGITNKKFKNETEYVLRDSNNGNLFKIATTSGAEVINRIKKFNGVELEENFSFNMQQSNTSNLINKPTRYITDDLDEIIKDLGLTEFKRSFKSQRTSPVKVAVIDSGFYNSDKFRGKLTINSQENIGNIRFDDDRNGYTDDLFGWNILNNSSQISDSSGHGTHISGIVMAFSELMELDATGIKVMPIQVLNEHNQVKLSDLLVALEYAQIRNVDIINMSLGSPQVSRILKSKLTELTKSGITVVAPAGNNNSDQVLYPARFTNVISVGALNGINQKASYSNYGKKVDVSTQGVVLSLSDDHLVFLQGTSQSTAIVTGVCAVLKATQNISGDECLAQINANSGLDQKLIPAKLFTSIE